MVKPAPGTVLTLLAGAVWLLLVMVLVWVMVTYRRLARLRHQVHASRAWVEAQLKRRHDLIPTLIETVRGYAGHERGTLEAVAAARIGALAVAAGGAGGRSRGPAARAEAESLLSQALARLFALSEAYPNLTANEDFSAVQAQFAGVQDAISYVRQFHDSAVHAYQDAIQSFPTSLAAGLLGFPAVEYFETGPPADRARVRIQS